MSWKIGTTAQRKTRKGSTDLQKAALVPRERASETREGSTDLQKAALVPRERASEPHQREDPDATEVHKKNELELGQREVYEATGKGRHLCRRR